MGNKMRILYAEDYELDAELTKILLEEHEFTVDIAADGEKAWDAYNRQKPDILLLDLNMPQKDGIEVTRLIRQKDPHTHIIIYSSHGEPEREIAALDAGADDYVTKPFGMMELISRIKAVLRRSANGSISGEDTFEIGEIRLDPKKHEVTVHGEVVNLTLKEYELLKRLMKNSNIVLTRDQLLEDIWGYDFDGETRTVDVHVRTLRQKLGDAGEQIETVRGVGYRMSR